MALQSLSYIVTFDMMASRLLQESARRHVGKVTHKRQEGSTLGSHTTFSANRPYLIRVCALVEITSRHLPEEREDFAGALEVIHKLVVGGTTCAQILLQAPYGHRQEQSVSIVVKKATGKKTTINASQKK